MMIFVKNILVLFPIFLDEPINQLWIRRIDRCVSKYLESQQLIGIVLQKANEAQEAQQAAMANMQKQWGG